MLSGSSRPTLPPLTGFRAIAAWIVYFHHWPPTGLMPLGLNIYRDMHIGVTMFFVLSGFLITYRYQEGYSLKGSWLFQYLRNRFARIYPLYFILCVLALAPRAGVTWTDWVLNLSLLKGFSDESKFIGIPPSWSLTVEECFYLSAPLIFFARDRFRSLLAPWGAYVALSFFAIGFGAWLDWHKVLSPWHFTLLYTIFGRFTEFFIGIWLAELVTGRRKAPGWMRIRFKTLIGFCGIAASPFVLSSFVGGSYYYGQQHPIGMFWCLVVLPGFVALAIHGLMSERTVMSRFLSTGFMQLMGKSSYAFYLTHYGWLVPSKISNVLSGDILGHFAAINAFSVACFKWVEEPLQRYFRGESGHAKSRRERGGRRASSLDGQKVVPRSGKTAR